MQFESGRFLCNTWLEMVRRERGTKLLDKCKIEPESHSLNTNGTKTQNNVGCSIIWNPTNILDLNIHKKDGNDIQLVDGMWRVDHKYVTSTDFPQSFDQIRSCPKLLIEIKVFTWKHASTNITDVSRFQLTFACLNCCWTNFESSTVCLKHDFALFNHHFCFCSCPIQIHEYCPNRALVWAVVFYSELLYERSAVPTRFFWQSQ